MKFLVVVNLPDDIYEGEDKHRPALEFIQESLVWMKDWLISVEEIEIESE